MTLLTDLTTARDALAAKLATESVNPQPSYSAAGRSFSWESYRAGLVADIKDLTQQILIAQGAVEIPTSAYG